MDPFVEAVRGAIRVVHYQHYNVSDGSESDHQAARPARPESGVK